MKKSADAGSAEYAKVKTTQGYCAMKVFSDPRFNIDVLKVEVPVNVKYVEGFVMVKSSILAKKLQPSSKHKMKQLTSIHLLECGVSAKLFQETLVFAHESGANFNGVLCGRATWAGSVEAYIKDGERQLVNGFAQLDLRTLTNSTRFFKQHRLHGLNVRSIKQE